MCTTSPDHHKTFCQNIAWLRQHHNLTQEEMAHRLGIGVKRLRSIEKGVMPRRLSADILVRIADEFDILPSDVLWTNLWEGPL